MIRNHGELSIKQRDWREALFHGLETPGIFMSRNNQILSALANLTLLIGADPLNKQPYHIDGSSQIIIFI